jgi:cell division protein ZapE
MSGLLAAYAEKIAMGELRSDPAQAELVGLLNTLANALEARERRGFLGKLLAPQQPPRGIYLYGDVGRGKTRLMDLFFENLDVDAKQRIHFHAFMQDVHRRRQALKTGDVIAEIARDLAAEIHLLCLDEMQITDIADAMIVGRLFEALMAHGTVIVTTSNLPPDALYKDGLNRDLFLPAIAMLKARLDVVYLPGQVDYRLGRVKAGESFIFPLGPEADAHMQNLWERLAETPKGRPMELALLGRTLHVPESAHGCARFSFAELCAKPLGPPDYLALAATFKTIFVEAIPVLKSTDRNEARRFVLLIDTLYDTHVRLVASAAQPPQRIFPKGSHGLEFARTVSRLQEMQSSSWWGQNIVET